MSIKTAVKKAETKTLPFGVKHVAKALSTKPNLARIKLRDANVKKAGKSYGWKTQAEVDAVAKKLKAA